MKRKIFSLLFSLLILLPTGLTGCSEDKAASSGTDQTHSAQAQTGSTPKPVKEPVTIRMVAAGDNLIHSSLYKQAKNRAGGNGYDFNYAYEHVKKLINGDINVLNQETLLASPPFEPSNYPLFSSPTAVGDFMQKMGFHVFTLANNHMLDKGTKGFLASLDYWDRQTDSLHTGAFRNQEDLEQVRTITKKDVTVGFLSVTEHTNGLNLPKDSELKILYSSDEAAIEKQIKATRKKSDFVVVAVHWGVENSLIVSDQQKALAKKMADWGADLIIGTHPHVLQAMEYIEREDGSKVLVAYSIGNFISAMNVARCMLGGVLDLEITKNYETGKTTVTSAQLIPLLNHYDSGYQNVRVYPLEEYTPELAVKHGIKRYDSRFSYEYIHDLLKKQIDQAFLSDALLTR